MSLSLRGQTALISITCLLPLHLVLCLSYAVIGQVPLSPIVVSDAQLIKGLSSLIQSHIWPCLHVTLKSDFCYPSIMIRSQCGHSMCVHTWYKHVKYAPFNSWLGPHFFLPFFLRCECAFNGCLAFQTTQKSEPNASSSILRGSQPALFERSQTTMRQLSVSYCTHVHCIWITEV